MPTLKRLIQLQIEMNGDLAQRVQLMSGPFGKAGDLPFHKAGFILKISMLLFDVSAARHRGFIRTHDLRHRAIFAHAPAIDPDCAITEPPDLIHLVADKDDCAAASGDFIHFAETLLLKRQIAHGEHFVHEQNLRLEMRRYSKRQAHLHAGAVVLEWSIQEFDYFGEPDDVIEFAGDLPPAHAENGAIQVDVFAARQLRMKAGADFEQAAHRPADFGPTCG